jgi:hypothetical protein
VGTLAYGYTGASLTEELSVGTITVGSAGAPPQAVLTACGSQVPADTTTAAYLKGQVTITYTGSFAVKLGLTTSQGVNPASPDTFSATAVQFSDGSWRCDRVYLNLTPGQRAVLPVWFLNGNVLSNAHPKLTSAETAGWYWYGLGNLLDSGSVTQPTSQAGSGPGAGNCYAGLGSTLPVLYVAAKAPSAHPDHC